jgi:hypothetical protein
MGTLQRQHHPAPMDLTPLLALVFNDQALPPSRLRPVVVGRPHPKRRLPRAGTADALLWQKPAK